jgi:hypothetical protein
MRFLSWLWRRPCAHVWVYATVVEDGRQVTRQRCIHCGKVGRHLDGFAGASGSVSGGAGGDGGGACDGG